MRPHGSSDGLYLFGVPLRRVIAGGKRSKRRSRYKMNSGYEKHGSLVNWRSDIVCGVQVLADLACVQGPPVIQKGCR